MAAKIKYGQIGVGHAHASKISVYRSSDDYDVVGVVEPDRELREAAQNSDTYRDLPFVTEEQLLNTPGLQVVGVETRVRDLLATAERCVAAGMHVHLDKPAGASLPQYRKILDDAAMRHVAVQMGYMYRYNPAILLLKDLLTRGWLGDVFEVHTVMSKLGNAALRAEIAEFSGGTMFELGCHIIDLVHGVLGTPDAVQPFARHSAAADDHLQDNMLAVFEYPRATATVRTSVLEVDGFARRHLAVCGTEGTLHIQPLDNPTARLTLLRPHGKYKQGPQDITFPKYSRYVGDAADLAKVVRHEKDPDFSYEHDFEVQKSVLLASGMPLT
ncbi:MAG: Gfo/Idh/MocA family oxidoreductase [Planctomycetaceae bacterium]